MSIARLEGGIVRNRHRLAVAIGVVALFGCGSQPASQSQPAASAGTATDKGEVHLTLAEFQLEDEQGKTLSMSADGTISSSHGAGGRIHEDGTVTSPDGAVRGRLLKSGSVVDAQGVERATIAEDGTAKVGNENLRFGDDGKLVGGNPAQAVRLKATDPKVRRTAMLLLVMMELVPDQKQ
jgi:hypothetical protein